MEVTVRGIRVRLSGEHVEVLRRVAAGQRYRQIGHELGLSARTVYKRVLHCRNAVGADSREEVLVLLAGLLLE